MFNDEILFHVASSFSYLVLVQIHEKKNLSSLLMLHLNLLKAIFQRSFLSVKSKLHFYTTYCLYLFFFSRRMFIFHSFF